ncbi:MAG: MBL fold metallo-hydrolase, partial [Clostridia bacterium]|nr:MBL fold metallo-hydrolase [Clostridia bacterium]
YNRGKINIIRGGSKMKIKFCGASSGVTGSCHLLTTENHKILLDCGQFQGGKAQEALNAEPFPFDPAEIECVVLSHAHIDHCGRIPLLVKRGFKGKIYCTDATADLLDVMLKDSGYIHEKDAERQNRKALRAGKPMVEPLYTYNDAVDSLQYVEPVLYDQLIELNDNMKIVFNDAGHILGSAITELWITEDGKESKIVFSGDLGMMDRPILRDPTIIKKADYVIMETTYGNRNHPENSTSINQLLDIVLKTIKRGGNVVIPSFAVGRTQELIFEFNKFYEEHSEYRTQLDKVKVYVDSPMATTATEVFRKNAQVFDEETKAYIMRGDNPLDFKNLKFTRTTAESQALNMDKSPKIIISASGMCEAGRIRHHLKHNLWDPRASVIFVGYQAEGTLGRILVEGTKDVTLFGEAVHVNAEIYNLEGFSGHADQNGLLAWISGFQKKPKQVFLVHGEEDSKKDFAKLITDKLGYDPVVVLGNSEFELDMNTAEITHVEKFLEEGRKNDDIDRLRNQLAKIHYQLENILYTTDLAVASDISGAKLTKINNLVQELDKDTLVLGSAITEEDRSKEEVSEEATNTGETIING